MGRKKKNKSPAHGPPPPAAPTAPKSTLARWGAGFVALVTVVGGIVSLKWYPTEPIVEPAGNYETTNPFSIAFTLRNPSELFSLGPTSMICNADRVRLGGMTIQDSTSGAGDTLNVGPGGGMNVQCPFDRMVGGPGASGVRFAQIDVIVSYDRPFWWPVSREYTFIWDGRRWLPGGIPIEPHPLSRP